jgi:hypothetical protein
MGNSTSCFDDSVVTNTSTTTYPKKTNMSTTTYPKETNVAIPTYPKETDVITTVSLVKSTLAGTVLASEPE